MPLNKRKETNLKSRYSLEKKKQRNKQKKKKQTNECNIKN